MSDQLGPTGDAGDPRKPGDKGGLNVKMVANRVTNQVEMHFGASLSWVSAPPDNIRQIALAMLRMASQLDGKILEVKTR